MTAAAPTAGPRAPATPPAAPPRRRRGPWGWIFWAAVLGGVYLTIRACTGGGDPAPRPGTPGAEASASPVDQYVTRFTRVRSAPSGGSGAPVGELRRGAQISGVWVPGLDAGSAWFRISDGDYQGRFVWGANLDARRPPPLRVVIRGRRQAAIATPVRARPSDDAAIVSTLNAGDGVDLAGRVDGGWFEVLRASGGVAYVRAETLAPPPPTPPPSPPQGDQGPAL